MERYLSSCGVLIKEFKRFAESVTAEVKAAAYHAAAKAGRPAHYLADQESQKNIMLVQSRSETGSRKA
jgi:hypothetical protein